MAYRAEPEGVLAVVEAPARELPRGGTLYLVAVGVEKPGNLGAMARTAEAAGADALVVAEAQADVWNPNAIRASTGAVFTLPVVEATLDEVAALGVAGRRRGRRRRRRAYTDADLTRADARSSSAPRTRASTSAGAPRPTSQVSIPMRGRARRQPQRRDRRRDPALRGGAPAWLAATTSSAPARSIGDRLPRTPMLASRTLGARLKCELFQRTGSFKPRGALNKLSSLTAEEKARGVIAISAGNHAQARRVRRGRGGRRRARRDVAGRVRAEDRRDARLRRDRRPRGDRPGRGVRAARRADRRDRPHARPPVRRPGRASPAPARSGSRSRRTRPTPTPSSSPVGGGGLIARHRRRARRTGMRDRRRRARDEPRAPRGDRGRASRSRSSRGSIADGLNAPFAGALPIEICRDLERVLVTEDEIEDAFRFLYERAKLACEPAGAAAAAALLAGKVEAERPVVIVSGGNVAAQTASGILARR